MIGRRDDDPIEPLHLEQPAMILKHPGFGRGPLFVRLGLAKPDVAEADDARVLLVRERPYVSAPASACSDDAHLNGVIRPEDAVV